MKIKDYTFRNNNKKIEVLDAIMGSGKTSQIIEWMNNNPNNKYIYVSPLLSETEVRIPDGCLALNFKAPNTDEFDTKADHLYQLLKDGENVAITHALFTDLTTKHIIAIDKNDYTLIIDEEIDFVYSYSGSYKPTDIETLLNSGHIAIDEGNLGRVDWLWDDSTFKEGSIYTHLKNLAELEMIYIAKRSNSLMVIQLPISLIKAVKRCIVLSYMFNGSVMDTFMRMRGMSIIPFTEVKLNKTEKQIKEQARNLIEIYTTDTVNKVSKLGLSANWYKNTTNKDVWKRLENAIRSACRKAIKQEDVMYTVQKDSVIKKGPRSKIKMRIIGYTTDNCYVGCNSRATNDYSNKSVLVHAYNRYPNAKILSYLQDYGFVVDVDRFALSEMVQWVWRSRIRKGQNIKVCIIPERMKGLFLAWLNS